MASRTPTSSRKTSARKQAAAPRRRSVLWRFRRGLFLVALLLVAGLAGAGFVLGQVEIPEEEPLLQSTFVCAADVVESCGPDNAIAKLAGVEDRVSVPLEEMPQRFIDAVLAAEDRQFFSHGGIDPLGIARAFYRDVRNEGARQGGSTITQQYAKNEYLSSERTITRKLKEAVLAVKLERELSKEEILERYLNSVYFGRGAYGAEAAARAYFGVSVREVDLPEAAYLAGLIRAPESADASRNPETATFRRDSVLAGMAEQGWITAEEHRAATAVPIQQQVRERSTRDGLTMLQGAEVGATHYVEYVRRLLYDKYGAAKVNGGGLRVYTTLDLDLQREAHDAVYGFLDQPDDPAGALVSVDDLGRVVAMVGGKDFEASQVNLALGAAAGGSGRQPGSSFKPIVLAAALDEGVSLESRFRNENEMTFPKANAGKDWEVSNYAPGREEIVDLLEATRISSNTVFAQLMLEIGPAAVARMAEELGVSAELPVVNSLALGGGDLSVLDMASAYSTFARRGEAIDPIIITRVEQVVDGEVEVLETASTTSREVLEPDLADEINHALRRVILAGTGRSADFGVVAAGKTGTTQDHRDAWFVGYTPRLTTAVWMGYPDLDENGDPILMRDVRGRRVTGGSFPAQIWRDFMQRALDGEDHGTFAPPGGFSGEPLNSDLTTTTTTTTLPPCEPVDGGEPPGDTGDTEDTEPCEPTTTTTTSEPDEEDTGSSTTTTSEPDEDDDGSTTTTSSTTSSSTTTTSTTTTTTPGTSEPGFGIGD